jgi:hypothetical protein
MIDCAGIADYGLDVISVKFSDFENLLIYRPVLVGVREDVLSIALATTEGNNATQFNYWKNVEVWASSSDSTTTVGWQQTGTNSHNINQNTYVLCGVVHSHGDALQVINADTNTWIALRTYALGKGVGVRLYGSDDAAAPSAFARLNIWLNPLLGGFAHTGTAQAGAASTITLASAASTDNSQYEDRVMMITGGTGIGQQRTISSYDGATKIATVSVAWTTQPDNTSNYSIYSGGVVAESGTTTKSDSNAMFGYHTSDGASPPIIESQVRFTYTTSGMNSGYATQRFTPVVTFVTPGDLSVTYSAATGRYWLDGGRCKFTLNLTFTPTYTTASGILQIKGLPYISLSSNFGNQFYPVNVTSSETTWTFGASKTQVAGRILAGGAFPATIQLLGMGSGVTAAYLTTAEFPTGTAKSLLISGEYEIN